MPPRFNKEQQIANQRRSLAFRTKGATYAQIAAEIGVSQTMAYKYVQKELATLDPIRKEMAERLRDLELERLDKLYLHLSDRITPAQDQARPATHELVALINTAVNIAARRAKLLGLDMPTTIAQTNTAGKDINPLQLTKRELEIRIEGLRRMMDEKPDDPPQKPPTTVH